MLTESVSGLEQAQEAQAAVTKEATQALEAEQRAKETLLSDLQWLKTELEKLTNVREDLKQRLASVLTRETKRRGVLAALLAKLRATEVTAAARIGSLRRLQAAIEKAQRNAVRVQTIYFQKQIGSLQRQVENMMGLRRR